MRKTKWLANFNDLQDALEFGHAKTGLKWQNNNPNHVRDWALAWAQGRFDLYPKNGEGVATTRSVESAAVLRYSKDGGTWSVYQYVEPEAVATYSSEHFTCDEKNNTITIYKKDGHA